MVNYLRHQFRNFTQDDYILPTGDPCLVAVGTCVAARNSQGQVRLLRWDRKEKNYHEVNARI